MTRQLTHKGGCHCGAVAFEVKGPRKLMAVSCNCSICRMSGFLHYIVEKDLFTLLSGEDNLTEYNFGSGAAKHLFCKTCGIKSFYIPRSHPDGFSVNIHCLDRATIDDVDITLFDGDNWEKNIDQLRES